MSAAPAGKEPAGAVSDASDASDVSDGSDESDGAAGDDGPDLASVTLARARAAARSRGAVPGRSRASSRVGTSTATTGRAPGATASTSGSAPDARDPQTLASSVGRLVDERGWEQRVAVGGVMGRWERVVGAQVAEHCRPVSFDDGALVVAADSTAWATQVRLLTSTLLRRLDEEVGAGVVTTLTVRGPASRSWRSGALRARDGRGPRDTYG